MKIRRIGMALAICFLMLGMPSEAEAAARPIHTVSVKVNSKLEPGGRLPSIGIGTRSLKDGEISVSGSNSKYHVTEAEWVDKGDKVIKASDEPRMKVTLEPADVGEDYFLASYKKSDVKVSGGTFVSARRDGDALVVTIRVNGVKGEYDPPPDAFWHEDNLGEARWEKPENTSGYYEAQLLRDGKIVYKLAKVSGLRYNFYPYMTEKGMYSFKIRTVPETEAQIKYGKKSEWIESGELEITDLNRIYLENGELDVILMGQGFTWLDTGTHESLVEATNFVKTVETHQHRKIACLEEIAYLNGWISEDEVLAAYEVYKKNQYGKYLKDVLDGKYVDKLQDK